MNDGDIFGSHAEMTVQILGVGGGVRKTVAKSKDKGTKKGKHTSIEKDISDEDEVDDDIGTPDIGDSKILLEANILKALSIDATTTHFDSVATALEELKSKITSRDNFTALLVELPKVCVANAMADISKKNGYRKTRVAKTLMPPNFVTMHNDFKKLMSAAEMIIECPSSLVVVQKCCHLRCKNNCTLYLCVFLGLLHGCKNVVT
jgi:hypothetical protein